MLHLKFPMCSYNLLLQLDNVGSTVDGQMGKYACMTSTAVHVATCRYKIFVVEHTVVGLSLAIYSSLLMNQCELRKLVVKKICFLLP